MDDFIATEIGQVGSQFDGLSHIGIGDVVLLHPCWRRHRIADTATFNASESGIGLEAAAWLIERDIANVWADTWAIEVLPNPDPTVALPVHMELIPRKGIFIHENIGMERLNAAGVSEFAYLYSPLPIAGVTGFQGGLLAAF